MREEIEHRELAAKLEKQLKRELYEAKKLEEERKAKELEAISLLYACLWAIGHCRRNRIGPGTR
jgi:hypothetical protein